MKTSRKKTAGKAGRRSRVALVCAGGGITGAVFEIGCLAALEEILSRSVLDFDLYVGVSGGAFVAALLASGWSPRALYDAAVSRDRSAMGVAASPLFRLGFPEFARRTAHAPRVLKDALLKVLSGEGGSAPYVASSLFEVLPPGLLDNSGIREYLQALFRARGQPDRFSALRRKLYVVGVDLDSGEAVAFGEKRYRDVPVSLAVQASTALPGLCRPVRIAGRDFIDGGVKKTAHINLGIRHGADLVICINPIVPILNDTKGGALGGHLSNKGVTYVLDQVLRIVLHGRMEYGMERYEAEHPDVDILLIEPDRSDLKMFSYHILRLSARKIVAREGYRSALSSFRRHRTRFERLLSHHGISVRPPRKDMEPPSRHRSALASRLDDSLDRLGRRLRDE